MTVKDPLSDDMSIRSGSPGPSSDTTSIRSGSPSEENDTISEVSRRSLAESQNTNEFEESQNSPESSVQSANWEEPKELPKLARRASLELPEGHKAVSEARRHSLPTIMPELREDTEMYIRAESDKNRQVENLNNQLTKTSKEKSETLQDIINYSDPKYLENNNKNLTPAQQQQEGAQLLQRFEEVLREESDIFNQRAKLLGEKTFTAEEIDAYVAEKVKSEKEHFELRVLLFAPQSDQQTEKLYQQLKKGGPALFDKWISALYESRNSVSLRNYLINPLKSLVQKARDSSENKEFLTSLIKQLYGQIAHLTWQECSLESAHHVAAGLTELANAMLAAARNIEGEASTNLNERAKYLQTRTKWENWAKEIWDSASQDFTSLRLMRTNMHIEIPPNYETDSETVEGKIIGLKILYYQTITTIPHRAYFFCDNTIKPFQALDKKFEKPPISFNEYVTTLKYEMLPIKRLKAEYRALNKQLTDQFIESMKKITDGILIEEILWDHTSKLIPIHKDLMDIYEHSANRGIDPPPPLEKILKNDQKKLFRAYVKNAVRLLIESEGNDFVRFKGAVEFAEYGGHSAEESSELLQIASEEMNKFKLPLWQEGSDLIKNQIRLLEAAIEKNQRLKKTSVVLQSRYRNVQEAKAKIDKKYEKEDQVESLEKRYARLEAVLRYQVAVQVNTSIDFRLANQHSDESILKVSEFERAKAWKNSEEPQLIAERDVQVKKVLRSEDVATASKDVGSWIKKGDLALIDHLVDFAITYPEKHLRNLPDLLQGGVKRALRNWKGKLFRSSRIETIKQMVKSIEERTNVEKWKHINDEAYFDVFQSIKDAVIAGITEAIPNTKELEKIIKQIFP